MVTLDIVLRDIAILFDPNLLISGPSRYKRIIPISQEKEFIVYEDSFPQRKYLFFQRI